jgi:transketolase
MGQPLATAELQRLSRSMREWIITRSLEAQVGHVGSALCVVDMLAVLWGRILRHAGTTSPERDYFIMSKGHAALALYCAMHGQGVIDAGTLASYCQDGSLLGAHPEWGAPGVDVATGSLGHGLSVGCGIAHGVRQQGLPGHVYLLMSDAECNEGQVWEAAMFAAHHQLGNLTALIDLNGLQAFGYTRDVLDLEPLAARWQAFGWRVETVDGHDIAALVQVLDAARQRGGAPCAIVAETVLGRGVPFMENRLEWHYRNLSPELAAAALAALAAEGP